MIKKITTDDKIDELARMVAKGFASTATKGELNGVRQDLNGVKQDLNEVKKDIREINMKLYDIDEYTRRNSR